MEQAENPMSTKIVNMENGYNKQTWMNISIQVGSQKPL